MDSIPAAVQRPGAVLPEDARPVVCCPVAFRPAGARRVAAVPEDASRGDVPRVVSIPAGVDPLGAWFPVVPQWAAPVEGRCRFRGVTVGLPAPTDAWQGPMDVLREPKGVSRELKGVLRLVTDVARRSKGATGVAEPRPQGATGGWRHDFHHARGRRRDVHRHRGRKTRHHRRHAWQALDRVGRTAERYFRALCRRKPQLRPTGSRPGGA